MNYLAKLFSEGVLGFYHQVEVTEIFAVLPDKSVQNIYTIMVAESRIDEQTVPPCFLNSKPITVKKLKGWSFGIKRYTKNIDEILLILSELNDDGVWSASGERVQSEEKFIYQPPRFVSPNSFKEVPLNNILKNNYWNGSYIVEWHNDTKEKILPLITTPSFLQELSEKIQLTTPVSLASLSDRLGNFIVQLPVTVVQARFLHSRSGNDLKLEVVYHDLAKPRSLRVNCEMEYDQIIEGFLSYAVTDTETILPMSFDNGPFTGVVWDEENGLILAAIQPSTFISSISTDICIQAPEPRVFKIRGDEDYTRVNVSSSFSQLINTEENSNQNEWIKKRLYRQEKIKLAEDRKFVQYKPKAGKSIEEHHKALSDIRLLITKYGQKGVWLWDPYLCGEDILKTLFYCPYSDSDLKALTNLSVPSVSCVEDKMKIGRSEEFQHQREFFHELDSNKHGIKLEFRARIGNSGWNFHDRFLIFPETQEGTLAWSLGTSINSIGKQHHILQKVDDAQLIADSFTELWDQLDKEEHLIWKVP